MNRRADGGAAMDAAAPGERTSRTPDQQIVWLIASSAGLLLGGLAALSGDDLLFSPLSLMLIAGWLGLLQVWLTSLTPDALGREGCPHAQEVPRGVQA